MRNFYLNKILKAIIGILLIIKGSMFIKLMYFTFLEIINRRIYTNISYSDYIYDPMEFVFTGLFIILFGAILISPHHLLHKLLISFSLIMPTYFIILFGCHTIDNFWFNFSLDFFNKIFIYVGMFSSSILMCHYNDLDWRDEIKKRFKISLIIGIILGIVIFGFNNNGY